ncbi:MAG: DUF748 domain-containing protein [Armatimonadota bacterium]
MARQLRRKDEIPQIPAMVPWAVRLFLPLLLILALCATIAVSLITSNWRELLRRATILHTRYAISRDVTLKAIEVNANGKIVLRQVTVAERVNSARPFFSASRIDVRFDPLQLSAQPLKPVRAVRAVALDTPFVSITRDATGVWNFDDLLKPSETPEADRFHGEILVTHGEVAYRDARPLIPGTPPLDERLRDVSLRLLPGANGYMPFRFAATSVRGQVRAVSAFGGMRTAEHRLSAEVLYRDLDLDYLQRFIPKTVSLTLAGGRASGRVQVALDMPPQKKAHLTATLIADLSHVRGEARIAGRKYPFDLNQGQLSLANQTVELHDALGTVDGVPVRVDGTMNHFTGAVTALQVETEGAEAARLARLVPGLEKLPFTWSGKASGWAQITGSLAKPHIVGHIEGPSLRTEFGEFQQLRGDIRFTGQSLEMTGLTGKGFGGDLAGDLWVSLNNSNPGMVLFTGSAQTVDVEQLTAQFFPKAKPVGNPKQLSFSWHDLHGSLSGPVTIKANRDGKIVVAATPRGTARLANLTPESFTNIARGDVEGGVIVEVDRGKATATIERLTARTPAGIFQVQGTVRNDEEKQDGALKLNVRASELKLAEISKITGEYALTGTGYLTGQLSGSFTQPRLTASIFAKSGTFEGRRYSDFSSDVLVSLDPVLKVDLQNARLLSEGNQFEFAGSLDSTSSGEKKWSASGKMALQRTPLSTLWPLLGFTLPIEGFAEGDVVFSNLPARPQGQGKLVLRRPTITIEGSRIGFDSATVEFTLSEQSVTLDNALVVYHGVPITLAGSVDRKRATAQQLYLQLSIPSISLDKLTTVGGPEGIGLGWVSSDARLSIPLDIEAELSVDATISAQLFPEGEESVAATLAKTLVVDTVLKGKEGMIVAGVPFQQLAATVQYRGEDRTLLLNHFITARNSVPGNYQISLAAPSTLHLLNNEVDLHLALESKDLNQVRKDLMAIVANSGENSPLQPMIKTLQSVPTPFAGKMKGDINLQGALLRPVIATEFTVNDLVVAGNQMPTIDGTISYDTAPRVLTIEQLQATGGPYPDAEASLDGTITVPVKDARGKEITPGPINLTFQASNLPPAMLGDWMRNSDMKDVKGLATIFATIDSTTSNPRLLASLDVEQPEFRGTKFDQLRATITLENNHLFIGRKTTNEDGETVFVPSLLLFKDSDKAPIKPLEVYGELPFRWLGPLLPSVPNDEPLDFYVRLPQQGLDLLRAYLPDFPKGDGTLEGSLEVHGTQLRPVISNGVLFAQAPDLPLGFKQKDLPDRLRQAVIDLKFHSDPTAGTNIIEVNNISAIYTQASTAPIGRKRNRLFGWFTRLFDTSKDGPKTTPGAIVAQGTIEIDPKRLLTAEGKYIPFSQMPNLLTYDLYAKTLRAPVQWQDLFQGRITSYLRLVNRQNDGNRPLLSGVVFAEDTTISYSGNVAVASAFSLADYFNPDFSLSLQIGQGAAFEITSQNTLVNSSFSVNVPFLPTDLVTPISPTDRQLLQSGAAEKPVLDKEYYAFNFNAAQFRTTYDPDSEETIADTRGWITGNLGEPVVDVLYAVRPHRALVELPGGELTVQEGSGRIHLEPTAEKPIQIFAKGWATTMIDGTQYRAAVTEGDLLAMAPDRILTITPVSSPRNATPLTSTQVYSRLFGVTDLTALLENRQDTLTPFVARATVPFLNEGFFRPLGTLLGLESLYVTYDPAKNAEATLVTPEFGKSHWSAFRLGATRSLSTPVTWRAWLDYRMPSTGLKNFWFTTEIDNEGERRINLQYQLRF